MQICIHSIYIRQAQHNSYLADKNISLKSWCTHSLFLCTLTNNLFVMNFDPHVYITTCQGGDHVSTMWTKSSVSYRNFRISDVEEFKRKHVSYMMSYVVVL